MLQTLKNASDLPLEKIFSHGVWKDSTMFLEINLVNKMEMATIEQIHRVKQLQLKNYDRLPEIQRLSRGQGYSKTCAFKEFRFEPPYVKKKEKRKKKLPPIPEHMLPKRHNSFDEIDEELEPISDLPGLPGLSISPAFLTERHDDRSLSVENPPRIPDHHLFNSREFTFPESSAKRRKELPSQPSIVPALTPRIRDTPLQAKIEKLAKQKRKDRAKRAMEKRYEKKSHSMLVDPTVKTHMAFKSKREPDLVSMFNLKEHKHLPFKQMTRPPEVPNETDKSKIHPRLYTKIVDSIYSYTKGLHDMGGGGRGGGEAASGSGFDNRQGPYERLMVTPVTTKEDNKGDSSRQLTFLPPIV